MQRLPNLTIKKIFKSFKKKESFMKWSAIVGWMLCLFIPLHIHSALLPEKALQKLMEGNFRYASDAMLHPRKDTARREAVASKQEPFAIILACSDSRVTPEIIFDQGLGDLFIVRVAGNIAGPIEMDSIDYGALVLHAPLILVLGHENCGAVNAVLHHETQDIEAIASYIEPALQNIHQSVGNALEHAIKENVRSVVKSLKESPPLSTLVKEHQLMILGGYYQLSTGTVSLLRD
jgi:carbonic anhydrase